MTRDRASSRASSEATSRASSQAIAQAIAEGHARAEARGEDQYTDPATGYPVFTAGYLRRRGACCGSGCRHCPFSPQEQRRAGRPER